MKATKRITRLCSILLAVVIVMAMSVSSAFAEDFDTKLGGQGSITIENATAQTSYTIYKIFDTTFDGGKGPTATSKQKEFYEKQSNNPFKFEESATSGTYNVSIAENKSEQDVINFLQSFVTETGVNSEFAAVTTSSTTTAEGSTLTFKNVPYGYYLVTSALGSVISLDSAHPDATIVDKNTTPDGESFKKTVDDEDKVVKIGEAFTYTIEFTGSNYDGNTQITEYTINDTLANGMELATPDNLTVTINGTQINGITINQGNDNDPKTFSITIPWAEGGNSKYSNNAKVVVKYDVQLTDEAVPGTDLKNKATLTWNGKTGEDVTVDETVTTYALAIKKVDEKGEPLEGVQFTLTDSNGNPVYVKSVSSSESSENVYIVDTSANAETGSNVVTTPASGMIIIKGVDEANYTVTETKSLNGYNLADPVTVQATAQNARTTTHKIFYDASGNVVKEEVTGGKSEDFTTSVNANAIVVVNKAGSELPSTGGMGTTVIYIVGGVLVAGAAVLLVTRRRMHA